MPHPSVPSTTDPWPKNRPMTGSVPSDGLGSPPSRIEVSGKGRLESRSDPSSPSPAVGRLGQCHKAVIRRPGEASVGCLHDERPVRLGPDGAVLGLEGAHGVPARRRFTTVVHVEDGTQRGSDLGAGVIGFHGAREERRAPTVVVRRRGAAAVGR